MFEDWQNFVGKFNVLFFAFRFLFAEKMKLEAENFLKRSSKDVEAPARVASKKQESGEQKGSSWDDGAREKTEWSTDSEDEVKEIDLHCLW